MTDDFTKLINNVEIFFFKFNILRSSISLAKISSCSTEIGAIQTIVSYALGAECTN